MDRGAERTGPVRPSIRQDGRVPSILRVSLVGSAGPAGVVATVARKHRRSNRDWPAGRHPTATPNHNSGKTAGIRTSRWKDDAEPQHAETDWAVRGTAEDRGLGRDLPDRDAAGFGAPVQHRGGVSRNGDGGPAQTPLQPHRGGAEGRAGHGVLGQKTHRVRSSSLSDGWQGLHRPDPGTDGTETTEADSDRPARRADHRAGPPTGSTCPGAHQGGGGAAAPAARRQGEGRPDSRRSRGALPGGARRRAPEARLADAGGDSDPLPHPADARQDAARSGRAAPRHRAPGRHSARIP